MYLATLGEEVFALVQHPEPWQSPAREGENEEDEAEDADEEDSPGLTGELSSPSLM